MLAASEQPHARESYLDKVERLATLDKQKQDACREATAQHYYAQFSFQPKINERSKRIARVRFALMLPFFLQHQFNSSGTLLQITATDWLGKGCQDLSCTVTAWAGVRNNTGQPRVNEQKELGIET